MVNNKATFYNLFCLFLISALMMVCVEAWGQETEVVSTQSEQNSEEPFKGMPFRVRNFTFPSFLMLGIAPVPTTSLGRKNYVFEVHFSKVNHFQMSPAVESYLAARGDDTRRPLDEADVDYIINLPEGDGYYIDIEVDYYEFAFHWGISDTVDVSVDIPYIHYTTGMLDSLIYNFHDTFGLGQQGRNYVADYHYQVVLGGDGEVWGIALDRPTSGGFGDPEFYLRFIPDDEFFSWSFCLAAGVKPSIANVNKMLSSGGWDSGFLVAADRSWGRESVNVNASLVLPGACRETKQRKIRYRPPVLPSLHLSWVHRMKHWPGTHGFVQVLYAEHPLRDLVNSDLSDFEFQMTGGFRTRTQYGILGFGITENLFNMDNTPDIGLHLSWVYLVK